MSSLNVVSELLESVVAKVCCEPVACTVPDHHQSRRSLDICTLLRSYQCSSDVASGIMSPATAVNCTAKPAVDLLTCFSMRQRQQTSSCVPIEVMQLSCVKQTASGYCGHYAWFFALLCLKMCQSTSICTFNSLVRDLTSDTAYWRNYWRCVKLLLGNIDGCWPWTKHHIYTGDMERSFMNYLMKSDPRLLEMKSTHNLIVLHFAYGLLQDEEDVVCSIQNQISMFISSPTGHLVFILGVTNHWVTLLAHKHPNKLCLLYLDSNNEPVLMAHDKHLLELTEKREQRYRQRKGKSYTEWERGVVLQAYKDQRDVCSLLTRCISGEEDLRAVLLNSSWSNLLDSYMENVAKVLLGKDMEDSVDLYVSVLVQWLETQHSPTHIRSVHIAMVMRIGHTYLSMDMRTRMGQWLEDCQTNLSYVQYEGFSRLVEFKKGLIELEDILKL